MDGDGKFFRPNLRSRQLSSLGGILMSENNTAGIKLHEKTEIYYFQFMANLSGGFSDTASYPLIKTND